MLQPPQPGGSNEYPQSMFWSKNKKEVYILLYKILKIKILMGKFYFAFTWDIIVN